MSGIPDYRADIVPLRVGPNSRYLRERGGTTPLVLDFKPGHEDQFMATAELIDFVNRRLDRHIYERAVVTIMKPGAGRPSGLRSVRAGQLKHIYNSYDGYTGIDIDGAANDFVDEIGWAYVDLFPDQGRPGCWLSLRGYPARV